MSMMDRYSYERQRMAQSAREEKRRQEKELLLEIDSLKKQMNSLIQSVSSLNEQIDAMRADTKTAMDGLMENAAADSTAEEQLKKLCE